MRPQYVTVSTVTTSTPLMMDTFVADFNASIGVNVTGTITYSVQYTLDPLFDPSTTNTTYYGQPANCKWFTFSAMSALTADNSISITSPIIALRLNVTAVSGGTARLAVVQQGGGR